MEAAKEATRLPSRLARSPAAFRSVSGAAAVEFAVAAPILLGLLVPVADLGFAYSTQLQVQQAVQAGAQYASNHPWNSESKGQIARAVTTASQLEGLTATPEPSQLCGCPTGSTISSYSCSSTCPDGAPAGYYVIVNAQYPYAPALPYSVLGTSLVLTAQSTVRTQ
jgi:Flp pilus assembly protein TadG